MSEENGKSGGGGGGCGCFSVGGIIAMILSWTYNHSWIYAIVHGVCGWFYVAYYLIVHKLIGW